MIYLLPILALLVYLLIESARVQARREKEIERWISQS
jgi:hypothetical protein